MASSALWYRVRLGWWMRQRLKVTTHTDELQRQTHLTYSTRVAWRESDTGPRALRPIIIIIVVMPRLPNKRHMYRHLQLVLNSQLFTVKNS